MADASLQNIKAPKNGYIFVYVSNESNLNVFFDNLQVIHTQGPLLEETHYYPFGLTMAGISSKAAGRLENKHKFNSGSELESKEFSDGTGLEWYATDFRKYDQQIGRFTGIDQLGELNFHNSGYVFGSNNPIFLNDPTGLMDSVGTTQSGETMYHEPGDNLEKVVVTPNSNKPRQSADYSTLNSMQLGIGFIGLGIDAYKNSAWKGSYNYRTTSGVVQSVFDTKYGQGRKPEKIGNINNYSRNARGAIRTTRFLRGASNTLIVAGLVIDWGQVAYAIATDDPNKNIFVMKSSVNTSIAAYGVLVPGVGWVVSGVYFLGDALIPGGWSAAIEAGARNTQNNREILGSNWNPRPGGGLGN